MNIKSGRDPVMTRKQLKMAAKREFNSLGYYRTDTNKIAKRAGYAPGTFYRHFKDKVEAFIEIYRDWHLEHLQEIELSLLRGGNIEEMSERLATIIINFYANWRTLRAGARVLSISEPRVAEFKADRGATLAESITNLRWHLGLAPLPPEEVTLFILLAERLGDAINDGNFDRPNFPPETGKRLLVRHIDRFLRAH
jgi:AcrR family transcriptional regulator